MQYLKDHQEYLALGGVCDATAFNRNIDRACGIIDNATHKRIECMAEVPAEDRILFITPSLYAMIADLDTSKSKAVLEGFNVVTVPQSRFYTAIELQDGTTGGEEAGGFKKAADAKDINFMIVHKPATLQYTKHTVNKVFSPEENQYADAWRFLYRSYGLTDVYENKVAGIYVHHKA